MKRSKYNMASFLIVLFYLAMSDFFGIVDFSLLFPGEMYAMDYDNLSIKETTIVG